MSLSTPGGRASRATSVVLARFPLFARLSPLEGALRYNRDPRPENI
jgi:hypothetical protein